MTSGRSALAAAAAAAALAVAGCAHGHGARDEGKARKEGQARTEGGRERSPSGKQAGMKPRPGAPRVPATPEGLLGKDAVSKLQKALADRQLLGAGTYKDGELDASTSAAVKKFQAQRGLATTGMPDRETLRDLGVSAEEAYGSSGDSP